MCHLANTSKARWCLQASMEKPHSDHPKSEKLILVPWNASQNETLGGGVLPKFHPQLFKEANSARIEGEWLLLEHGQQKWWDSWRYDCLSSQRVTSEML